MDGLIAAVWIPVTVMQLFAAWRVSRYLSPDSHASRRVGETILLWWSWLVLALFSVGILGQLNGGTLIATSAAYAAMTFGCVAFAIGRRSTSNRPEKAESVDADAEVSESERRFWKATWGLWLAWLTARVLTYTIFDYPSEWDTLMYHLPLVDQWIQAGSLYAPNDAVWYNPSAFEAILTWLAAPFSGDFLAGLGNLPVVLLLAGAALELGGEIGLRRRWNHVAALAITSNFVVFRQVIESKNDTAVAALFVAALAWGLRYARSGDRSAAFYMAIAFGLLCGVKYYALGYAAVAGGALLIRCAALGNFRRAKGGIVAATVGFASLSGFWYARNWIAAGSPIYPKGVGQKGDALGNVAPNLWETTLAGNPSPDVLPLLSQAFQRSAGPAFLASATLAALTVGWLLASAALRRFSRPGASGLRVALAVAIAGSGAVLAVTPFGAETVAGTLNMLHGRYLPARFGTCFLTLSLLGLAVMFHDASLAVQRVAGNSRIGTVLGSLPWIVFAAGVGWQLFEASSPPHKGNDLTNASLAANIALIGTLLLLVRDSFPAFWRRAVPVLALLAFVAGSVAIHVRSANWHSGFASHYDGRFGGGICAWMDSQSPSSVKVCVLGDRYFQYLGSRRQFFVCRASYLNSRRDAIAYLVERRVDHVIAVRTPSTTAGIGRFDRQGDWLLDHPLVFRRPESIEEDPNSYYRLWEIDRARLFALWESLERSNE